MPDKKFIYILWQSQTFFARQKNDLNSVKLVFVPAQSSCSQIFGLAQKIWTGTKHFETCKKANARSQNVLGWSKFFVPDQNLFKYCGRNKHFVPDKKMICIQ